jgi:hypothetical protein
MIIYRSTSKRETTKYIVETLHETKTENHEDYLEKLIDELTKRNRKI